MLPNGLHKYCKELVVIPMADGRTETRMHCSVLLTLEEKKTGVCEECQKTRQILGAE